MTRAELVAMVLAKLDVTIAASAARLRDDLLSSADGFWRSRDDVEDSVNAYLEEAEASKAHAVAVLHRELDRMLESMGKVEAQCQ